MVDRPRHSQDNVEVKSMVAEVGRLSRVVAHTRAERRCEHETNVCAGRMEQADTIVCSPCPGFCAVRSQLEQVEVVHQGGELGRDVTNDPLSEAWAYW